MSIFSLPTRTRHHQDDADSAPDDRPRVPSFAEVRQTTGPAAEFDWGFTLQPMTMAEIAALEPAEWETAPMQAPDLLGFAAELRELLDQPSPATNWLSKLAAEFGEQAAGEVSL